jgi:hypothetical protein
MVPTAAGAQQHSPVQQRYSATTAAAGCWCCSCPHDARAWDAVGEPPCITAAGTAVAATNHAASAAARTLVGMERDIRQVI